LSDVERSGAGDGVGAPNQVAYASARPPRLRRRLAQLRAKGADVADETQDMEAAGRFGWVTDAEGNRVELWQPS